MGAVCSLFLNCFDTRIQKFKDGEVVIFIEKLWCGLLDYSTRIKDVVQFSSRKRDDRLYSKYELQLISFVSINNGM